MAQIRQSRPDSGFGFQVQGLDTLQGVPSSLGSGPGRMGPAFRPRNVDQISVFEALLDLPGLGWGKGGLGCGFGLRAVGWVSGFEFWVLG